MKKITILLAGLCLVLASCTAPAQVAPATDEPALPSVPEITEASPTQAPEPSPVAPSEPPAVVDTQGQGLPLVSVRDTLFNGSGNCAVCHTNMTDMAGKDVSTDRFWRATSMANSARDPYWQASVRREVLISPAYQEVIEDKCATCHMPMARFTDVAEGGVVAILDQGYINSQHPKHPLAMDGISCTLCHQIQPDNFDSADSFSGHYLIDSETPAGERILFGPYGPQPGLVRVMQGVSGFIPQLGAHIEESAMCGTCHNLNTPFLDAQDQVAGEFPEQAVYTEWLNSAFVDQKSCQVCHMPVAQGGVQLSTTGGPKRSPFYQHYFVGGNQYMPQIYQVHGDELGVTASNDQFETTIQNTQDLLTTQTASLAIENPVIADGTLSFEVLLQSQVGHKFPAGFPSRRAWLHVMVRDVGGQVVFESGAPEATGAISGNDHDLDMLKVEPHYTLITNPGQVQIYESIMMDTEGQPTTTLLRGSAYIKDNRLLPQGFDKAAASADIAVYGDALADADFQAGEDRVAYQLDLSSASGPFTIQVELLYQTISFRWAENIKGYNSMETERFVEYYAAMPNLPFTVASVEHKTE